MVRPTGPPQRMITDHYNKTKYDKKIHSTIPHCHLQQRLRTEIAHDRQRRPVKRVCKHDGINGKHKERRGIRHSVQ